MRTRQKQHYCPLCSYGVKLLFYQDSIKGKFNCPNCKGLFYIELSGNNRNTNISMRERSVLKEEIIQGVKCTRCKEVSKKIFRFSLRGFFYDKFVCDICKLILTDMVNRGESITDDM